MTASLRQATPLENRPSQRIANSLFALGLAGVLGCLGCFPAARIPVVRMTTFETPLTASSALGRYDSARDASLRLVVAGLDEDQSGDPSRALANYQRAVRVDPTNPHAFLALSRHNLEGGYFDEAGAFLDQARSLFESEGSLGPAVDVWGLGLRAGIDRGQGRSDRADELFERARELSPGIWGDERLSAAELR